MYKVGLTGGSGSGKSTVAASFIKRGYSVFICDSTYHSLLKLWSPLKKELVEAFGKRIKKEDGEIDRKELGRIVFNHPKKLEKLNSITHKYIFEYMDLWMADQEKRGVDCVIIDAPVLFESGLNKECDLIIAVTASDENRIKRIIERDNITEEEALKRIRAQKTNQFYLDNGCHVIENNGSLAELELAVYEAELLIDCRTNCPIVYEIDTDAVKDAVKD